MHAGPRGGYRIIHSKSDDEKFHCLVTYEPHNVSYLRELVEKIPTLPGQRSMHQRVYRGFHALKQAG